jgi:drug/metabolite transporter (DMT)-like permease
MTDNIHHSSGLSRAYSVLLLGIIGISLSAIFIRLAQAEGISSNLISAGRMLIATLAITPAVLTANNRQQLAQLNKKEIGLILLAGFFLAIHFIAWVTSLEYTSVLISGVLVTSSPIWVALLEVFVLKAKLPRLVILGLAIAMIGGIIIGLSGGDSGGGTGEQSLFGAGLATFGAIAVAVYMIVGRRMREKLSVTPYIWSVYGVSAILLCSYLLITSTPVTGYSVAGYGWIAASALVPQVIGHSSLNYVLGYLPATYVSLSTQTEPIISAIAAYFVFQEMPAIWQVVGGAVIMCGVVMATIAKRESSK